MYIYNLQFIIPAGLFYAVDNIILKKTTLFSYIVFVTIKRNVYSYYGNICGGINFKCLTQSSNAFRMLWACVADLYCTKALASAKLKSFLFFSVDIFGQLCYHVISFLHLSTQHSVIDSYSLYLYVH